MHRGVARRIIVTRRFDYASPYSYLANTQLPDLAKRTGADFVEEALDQS